MGFMTVIRSTLALLAALLLGGTLLAAAPTASATTSEAGFERADETQRLASCNWRRGKCFGAISLNTRTGVVGFSNDKRSKSSAIRIGQSRCRTRSVAQGGYPGQCTKAGWVRNGCLAVAIRVRNGAIVEWGSGYAYNDGPAKQKAKQKVRGPGRVRIQFWLCTTRDR